MVAVLDDEPEMRKAFRRLLACHGFRVQEYGCARDFLAELEPHPPACLLLDLQMPGVDGFEVLETLHARHLTVPVVVVTAHEEAGTPEKARALGAAACLRKPVDRAALVSAIQDAISAASPDALEPDSGFPPNA